MFGQIELMFGQIELTKIESLFYITHILQSYIAFLIFPIKNL